MLFRSCSAAALRLGTQASTVTWSTTKTTTSGTRSAGLRTASYKSNGTAGMQSKNKPAPTKSEREHIVRIKRMSCALCEAGPPSDCHEIKQGQWFTSVPLCRSCHTGSRNGLHGERIMWRLMKMDELDVLAITIRRLLLEGVQ